MTATIAFVNQKGGVGKTSVTLGMASAAWAAGHRVLVVDVDPQGSATWVLGIDPTEVEQSAAEAILAGRSGAAAKTIVPSTWGDTSTCSRPAGACRCSRPATAATRPIASVGPCTASPTPTTSSSSTARRRSATSPATPWPRPATPSWWWSRRPCRCVASSAVADAIDDVWSDDNPELDLAGVIVNKVPAVSS